MDLKRVRPVEKIVRPFQEFARQGAFSDGVRLSTPLHRIELYVPERTIFIKGEQKALQFVQDCESGQS